MNAEIKCENCKKKFSVPVARFNEPTITCPNCSEEIIPSDYVKRSGRKDVTILILIVIGASIIAFTDNPANWFGKFIITLMGFGIALTIVIGIPIGLFFLLRRHYMRSRHREAALRAEGVAIEAKNRLVSFVRTLFWGFAGLIAIAIMVFSVRDSYELYVDGQEAVATVGEHYRAKLNRHRRGRTTTSHYHEIHFDGHTLHETDLGKKYEPGTTFHILYAKGNPSNWISGEDTESFLRIMQNSFLSPFWAIVFLCGGLFCFYASFRWLIAVFKGEKFG